jgi:LysR family transcriptional regulator, cyn operon transcriptional activator
MNLQHLRLLETLTRTGSLRGAAEELGTSQPRLTQQLQKMERDLGAVLFLRSPHGLTLSEAGRAFLPFARRISSTFNSAQSAISELGQRGTRRLRIGISITASLHLVPGNLLSFHKRHPDVLVSVTRALPKQLLRGVEEDQFDLCLGLELPDSSLITREEVFSTTMAGFSVPSMKAMKSLTLEQFCRFPLVLPPRSCGTRVLLEDALKRSGAHPQVLMEVDDVGTIIAIVKAGVAATILPRILPSASRSLVLSEISNFSGEVKGVLLYPRSPTPEARSFMEIASIRITSQTDWKTV